MTGTPLPGGSSSQPRIGQHVPPNKRLQLTPDNSVRSVRGTVMRADTVLRRWRSALSVAAEPPVRWAAGEQVLDTGAYQTLAEFAIALSGFVGLVVAFRRREGRFHPADEFRIFIALVPGLAGAFLALLPVGLEMLVLEPATTLILSSVIYAAVVLLVLLVIGIRNGRLPPDARAVLSRPLTLFFYALFGISVVANLANAMSLFGEPRSGVYFFGIVAILANSATVFARIVFIRPPA